MNILLLTGIQEELKLFFHQHPFEFVKKHRVFRSRWYDNLFAATTGPGIKKKREIRRLLEELMPEVIINAGLVGALDDRDSIQVGDLLRLGSVIDSQKSIIYPGGPGHDTLITVDHPVFAPWEKFDLHLDHGSRVCDMEAARLIELVCFIEPLAPKTIIVFCKVCGDLPYDYSLFKHEHLVRGWPDLLFKEKLRLAFRFPGGPFALKKLLDTKAQGLSSLTLHMHRTLKQILDSGGQTDKLDSRFRPHIP